MNVGFSGTRSGLTQEQRMAFIDILNDSNLYIDEFHHGDCVEADETAFNMVKRLSPWTNLIAHPGCNKDGESPQRAYTKSDVILKTKPYLRRNVDIIKASGLVIACPGQAHEMKRGSGTWQVIRECRNRGKKCIIIYPDGRVRRMDNAVQSRQNLEVSS